MRNGSADGALGVHPAGFGMPRSVLDAPSSNPDVTGRRSAGGMSSLFFPPLAPTAVGFGYISLALGGLSTVFTESTRGVTHGRCGNPPLLPRHEAQVTPPGDNAALLNPDPRLRSGPERIL